MAWRIESSGPNADLDDALKAWRRDLEIRKGSRGLPGDESEARSVPALLRHGFTLRSPDVDAAVPSSSSTNTMSESKGDGLSRLGASTLGPPMLGGDASRGTRRPMRLFDNSAPGSPERALGHSSSFGSLRAHLQEPQSQPQASPDRPRGAYLAGLVGAGLRPSEHPDELVTSISRPAMSDPAQSLALSNQQVAKDEGPGAKHASLSQEEAARKLAETRLALREREQELKDLESPDGTEASDGEFWQEREVDDFTAMMTTPGSHEPTEVLRLRQELRAADERIASLEDRLKQRTCGHWMLAGSDEAPSDASTAVSCGLPFAAGTSEVHWNQRAQNLEIELRSESATAMEIQDRIHWLRSQLRKQPGLQDERVNSIRNLLADIADEVEAAAKSLY